MWWIIAALILLGIVLMLIELLLIPGVGVAGVLSFASLAASCWYAFNYCGSRAGIITTIVTVILLVIMAIIILREKTWKKLELSSEITAKVNAENESVQPGQQGRTLTRLAPMGTAVIDGVTLEVKSSDNSMIAAGTDVQIVAIEDNKVIVKPLNN